jgi:hypothetical protein
MTEKKTEHKDDVVKTGPPVDERVDDGRKDDHLADSHPRPQGALHGDEHEVELRKRAKFLRDNPFNLPEK